MQGKQLVGIWEYMKLKRTGNLVHKPAQTGNGHRPCYVLPHNRLVRLSDNRTIPEP